MNIEQLKDKIENIKMEIKFNLSAIKIQKYFRKKNLLIKNEKLEKIRILNVLKIQR